MLKAIREHGYNIHSITIARNGYLVLDAYVAHQVWDSRTLELYDPVPAHLKTQSTSFPYDQHSKHETYDYTFSLISALVGIAIDQGYIESVNQPVLDLFPELTVDNLDDKKKAQTIEHLLMMTSGLTCNDSTVYTGRKKVSKENLALMTRSRDWIQHVLDLPTTFTEPGEQFRYCKGAAHLLSGVLQKTTGMSAGEFAQSYLFEPLGISDVVWTVDPQGVSVGWGGLGMTAHDMTKVGHLYLNEGLWDGQQVVPAGWIEASTQAKIEVKSVSTSGAGQRHLPEGYGYLWWVDKDHYMAIGWAGQHVIVVPEQNMVVTITAGEKYLMSSISASLLKGFILPAIKSPTPLSENPEGMALLEAEIEAFTNASAEP